MKKRATLTIFLMMICVIGLVSTCKGQSFYAHKYHKSFSGIGQTIKTKTLGQKIRTKVKYNKKRHHSERFAFRNMRQRSRAGQI